MKNPTLLKPGAFSPSPRTHALERSIVKETGLPMAQVRAKRMLERMIWKQDRTQGYQTEQNNTAWQYRTNASYGVLSKRTLFANESHGCQLCAFVGEFAVSPYAGSELVLDRAAFARTSGGFRAFGFALPAELALLAALELLLAFGLLLPFL